MGALLPHSHSPSPLSQSIIPVTVYNRLPRGYRLFDRPHPVYRTRRMAASSLTATDATSTTSSPTCATRYAVNPWRGCFSLLESSGRVLPCRPSPFSLSLSLLMSRQDNFTLPDLAAQRDLVKEAKYYKLVSLHDMPLACCALLPLAARLFVLLPACSFYRRLCDG